MTKRLAQLLELIESPCQLTVTAPPQLSLLVTLLVSGAGTKPAQLTVRLLVQLMMGGLVSWTVMVWAQVAQLPLLVTLLVSGAGTWLAQLTVRLVGQVRLGGLVA